MNDILITTFPMKPLSNIKVGTFTAPLYVEFLSQKLNCKSVLSLNLLNSYKKLNDNSKDYLKILNNIGMNFDEVFIDYYNKEKLLNSIDLLFKNRLIVEQNEEFLICDCNKVDIKYSTINDYTNYDLIESKNGEYYCKDCGNKCKIVKEKRLFLIIDEKYLNKVQVIPNIYDDNLEKINELFSNKEFLISKNRETGIKYRNYNIDVDFVWNNYINLFTEKNIVIVTSNKHLMKVFITNYLATVFGKNIIYILHPYIEKKEPIIWENTLYQYDEYYKKLFLLYSPKWNSRDCYYDVGLFKSLAKLRVGGRSNLYNFLIKNQTYDNLYLYLNKFITRTINFQKNLNNIKQKKLLISDYDNTFHVYYDSLLENKIKFKNDKIFYDESNMINKVNKFRNNNLFCINTGRSYNSLKGVSPNLTYDFLICNNGCEIYDSQDNLLNYECMNTTDIKLINEFNFNQNCEVKKYYPKNIFDEDKLLAVSIKCTNKDYFDEIVDYFSTNLIETKCYYLFPKIRLVNNKINKNSAIDFLIKRNYISKDNIYVIGDDDNDLPMLKNYNSATMKWCSSNIEKLNLNKYDNIIDYINYLEGKDNEK